MSDISKEKEVTEELGRLPEWLKAIPHINTYEGIKKCETAEDYIDTLHIFHSSIIKKADEIEHSLSSHNLDIYTTYVHSLKSMAALIGADKLSKKARELETAAKENNYEIIKQDTPVLLNNYRELFSLLMPLNESNEPSYEYTPAENSRNIVYIHSNTDTTASDIEAALKKNHFSIISIADEPEVIASYEFNTEIILYMPDSDKDSDKNSDTKSDIRPTMNLLGELCRNHTMILCLIGDNNIIEEALSLPCSNLIAKCYQRSADINYIIRDMNRFSGMLIEYHRRKNLFIVDDDPDYLSVIRSWLKKDYNIFCFQKGDDLLEKLNTSIPDLILLDYEMPEPDGVTLLKMIRDNGITKDIPVIFLTGKNDRENVNRILAHKPDGYLLKNLGREALADAIRRSMALSRSLT